MKNMNPHEVAVSLFTQGYNCSQAVLSSFCDRFAMDTNQAARVASAFGGGVALQNSICGAVSGALMVIGLSCEMDSDDPAALKKTSREKSLEFINQFKDEYGSINCGDLLGYNLSIENEYKEAADKGLFSSRCSELVKKAAKIVDRNLSKE